MSILASKDDIKLALVVDDSVMQCKVLSVLLKEEGYRVFTANDGARGVAMYVKYQPDLVLMDINMPIMDGYQAARKIKSLSQENSLCPLIFITSMDTDQAFIESIEAGGDGILVRPFSPEVFKAKIKSIQRISDLYAQVKTLQQEQQVDAELAEKLMSDVIESRNFGLDRIGIIKQAAALFSGDIQLSALCPNGNVNVLLGDFTGHGLRSSIGAIPLAETFRAMSKKGFSLFDIVSQINVQLFNLLPPDLFLGASIVTLSPNDGFAYILNAGLPDAYVFSELGEIKHQIPSTHPPLGVLKSLIEETQVKVVTVAPNDRIVLISDGIVEARNEFGEMYEFERFEAAAKKGVIQGGISEEVLLSVNEFCQSTPQEDDISLVDIPCGEWEQVFVINDDNHIAAKEEDKSEYIDTAPSWKWQLYLTGERLVSINPIPMAMSQIDEIEGDGEHWQNLFTILTELYVNALDHGVLGLSSDLKENEEGFVEYFNEREARLKKLNSGYVDIKLSHFPIKDGGKVIIKIKDSGMGFDINKHKGEIAQGSLNRFSGRGIDLVMQLCTDLKYQEYGTLVEATYVWSI